MGLICRMVVTEQTAKAIISTTMAVIRKSPRKACHMVSMDVVAATAKTAPRAVAPSLPSTGTPTTKRFFS